MSAGAGAGLAVTCRSVVYIYRLEGYDVVALSGVDLDIAPGEAVAMLGPSGSGKSTLLSVLAGLLPPSAGQVRVGEHDLVKATARELARMRATDVGVVLQGAWRNLLPYLSAEQNVRFAQRAAPAGRDLPPAPDVLSQVGLDAQARQRPAQLTPGQRQRLALAVGLANRPGLLLADEPTSQLDTAARDDVAAALAAVRQHGTTVVVVTHDPEIGARMGRTVTIRDGRVGAEGRRGEDYSVVGRDGTVHLPPEILAALPPGTLLRVHPRADGSVLLRPADAPDDVPDDAPEDAPDDAAAEAPQRAPDPAPSPAAPDPAPSPAAPEPAPESAPHVAGRRPEHLGDLRPPRPREAR